MTSLLQGMTHKTLGFGYPGSAPIRGLQQEAKESLGLKVRGLGPGLGNLTFQALEVWLKFYRASCYDLSYIP